MLRHFPKYSVFILAVFVWSILLLFVPLTAGPVQASAAGFSASWPYKADIMYSSQVIVVEAQSLQSHTGMLSLYEKAGGQWKSVLSGIPVSLGSRGIGKTKEGDQRSPSGIFPLGAGFGSAANPGGLKISYSRTTGHDYWVDDPLSTQYNQWVSYTGNPNLRWRSYERLLQPLYKYAIVLRYNDAPVVSGKGSAIFMHIWSSPGKPTAGCIAMSESHLLRLMRRLDPALSPAIAIGISG